MEQCEVEKVPKCGEGEHLFQSFGKATCFWVSSSSQYKKSDATGGYTWTQAQAECKARGMQLASLHSQQEQDFLWGEL